MKACGRTSLNIMQRATMHLAVMGMLCRAADMGLLE